MIIKEKSMDKVQQMIDEAQKNAKARLLKVDNVFDAIKEAEEKLKELGIAKKYWIGCRIIIDPESVPIRYDFKAMGTTAILERKASGWDLINVFREKCKHEPYGRYMRFRLVLSDVAHANIPKEYIL